MNLMEIFRLDDVAKAEAEGRPICIKCRWSCDDPELDLCCDCADELFMKAMLRGEYGAQDRREARASAAGAELTSHTGEGHARGYRV